MAFPQGFLDEIRARVSLVDTVAGHVRLSRRGRENTGLCPFHNEKTPSFTVSEEKGFYHCFGCGAHGDVISFEMQISGLSFPEAVEKLAGQAGLEMPRETPDERQARKRRATLHEVLEAACAFFETRLGGQEGAKARRYLESRGVSPSEARRFRLGYAPPGHALREHLTQKEIPMELIVESGLVGQPDDGRAPYDMFRDRLIFPITDRSGRVIAFGGRVLGDGQPKYLNSPESPIFHKGETLYGLAQARESVRESREILVAEGYMDVIALAGAGFRHAVAPLGTALTERQILLLWKAVSEPTLCFDGDAAGYRAARRAAERALPVLRPGCSLKFAVLPPGEDPDDLLKKPDGTVTFQNLLESAVSLSDFLWESMGTERRLDTPERRAAFEQDMKVLVRQIKNERLRTWYADDYQQRLSRLFSGYGSRGGRNRAPITSSRRQDISPPDSRARSLLAYMIQYPGVAQRFLESLSTVEMPDSDFSAVQTRLLTLLSDPGDVPSAADIHARLESEGYGAFLRRLGEDLKMLADAGYTATAATERIEGILAQVQNRDLKKEMAEILAQTRACETDTKKRALWEKYQRLKKELEEETS